MKLSKKILFLSLARIMPRQQIQNGLVLVFLICPCPFVNVIVVLLIPRPLCVSVRLPIVTSAAVVPRIITGPGIVMIVAALAAGSKDENVIPGIYKNND